MQRDSALDHAAKLLRGIRFVTQDSVRFATQKLAMLRDSLYFGIV